MEDRKRRIENAGRVTSASRCVKSARSDQNCLLSKSIFARRCMPVHANACTHVQPRSLCQKHVRSFAVRTAFPARTENEEEASADGRYGLPGMGPRFAAFATLCETLRASASPRRCVAFPRKPKLHRFYTISAPFFRPPKYEVSHSPPLTTFDCTARCSFTSRRSPAKAEEPCPKPSRFLPNSPGAISVEPLNEPDLPSAYRLVSIDVHSWLVCFGTSIPVRPQAKTVSRSGAGWR
jgi:hypothetical protein